MLFAYSRLICRGKYFCGRSCSCSCCLRAGAASAFVYGPLMDMTANAAAHAVADVLMMARVIINNRFEIERVERDTVRC